MAVLKLLILNTFPLLLTADSIWHSTRQSQRDCDFESSQSQRLRVYTPSDNHFFGGNGGDIKWATSEGRIFAISWGISQPFMEYNYNALSHLQFRSDHQQTNITFGTDPVDFCPSFELDDDDHIIGFRVLYRDFVNGLYFHTRNGLSYQCVSNIANNMDLIDTGDLYVNNTFLSGFQIKAGGVIDGIKFFFTECVYPATSEPTLNPTFTTLHPTPLPTVSPTVPTSSPTAAPTSITINPTLSPTLIIEHPVKQWYFIIGIISVLACGGIYLCRRNCVKCILMIYRVIGTIHVRSCVSTEYVIDKALVLIIGVSQFNFNKPKHLHKRLPGVESNVESLIFLWETTYNYDVFVCNRHGVCTKDDIIDFIDTHAQTLRDDDSYQAVLVHILSHGLPNKNEFITSDEQIIKNDFIAHELSYCSRDVNLIKVIFYDACRGEANYYKFPNAINGANKVQNEANIYSLLCGCNSTQNHHKSDNTNEISYTIEQELEYGQNSGQIGMRCFGYKSQNDVNDSNPYLNCVILYATLLGRSVDDNGMFTECICDVFATNAKSNRICNCTQQMNFISLIKEISNDLFQRTDQAQICTDEGIATLRQTIKFKPTATCACVCLKLV
eukprot:172441_1